MAPLVIGGQAFDIRSSSRAGRSHAHAVRLDTGDRFGPDFPGVDEPGARAAVTRWLEWQHEHAAALGALQDAERIYHRAVAGHAFGTREELDAGLQARRESLTQVEAARVRLDEVRARRPG
ncbi:MAG: hypothetical protein AB7I13_06705 [Vicinamibacterales bacterium]